MTEAIYSGRRTDGGVSVWKRGSKGRVKIDWRLDLWNHSPTGPEWGYGGSGPAQLALMLLADALGDDDRAIDLHQSFKWEVVSQLDHLEWELTAGAVRTWADAHDQARADQERRRQMAQPIDLSDEAHAQLLAGDGPEPMKELYRRAVDLVKPKRAQG